MVQITCWVAPCSAGCWCCMNNSIQPLNDQENKDITMQNDNPGTVEESQPTEQESFVAERSESIANEIDIADDNRPNSAKSTTSTIMETNTDELMNKTLQ